MRSAPLPPRRRPTLIKIIPKEVVAQLVQCLGVEVDLAAPQAMVEEVIAALNLYRAQAVSAERTAARIVATLKPLFTHAKHAKTLRDEILKLDQGLRLELSPLPDDPAISDNELGRPDRVMAALEGTIDRYSERIASHRPQDGMLRIVAQQLDDIFLRHNKKPDHATIRRRTFTHVALSFAGIDHADPVERPGRFDELLRPQPR